MSFDLKFVLFCDNGCGAEEDYSEDFETPYDEIELPTGWEENYDNGDSIFKHVCGECVEEFKEWTDG